MATCPPTTILLPNTAPIRGALTVGNLQVDLNVYADSVGGGDGSRKGGTFSISENVATLH